MTKRRWHTLTASDVVSEMKTDAKLGLTADEAKARQERYGPNKLYDPAKASAVKLLAGQFRSLVVFLLIAAAAVAFLMNDVLEGIAILVVIFLNAGIGFIVELKANRAMEALQKLGVQNTLLIRDGKRIVANAQDVVPGDIVELEAGDSVTADARLIDAFNLRAQEAALTGESEPVDKATQPVPDPACPLGDRASMIYKATSVVAGTGRAVVVATGMATEVGKIAEMVTEAHAEETPLEARLRSLGRSLVIICLAVAVIVIVAGIVRGRPAGEMLLTGIALAVAAVPEGLPAVATIGLAVGMWRMARRNALIRRLPAVETLGSATVICSDKTGTLTENKMTAVKLALADGPIDVTGIGFTPEGQFNRASSQIDPREHEALGLALTCAALCNNSSLVLDRQTSQWKITGDPTEAALVVAAAKAGLDQDQLRQTYPEIREVPFSSETFMMATIHTHPAGGVVAFVKGSPMHVIEHCTKILTEDGERELTPGLLAEFDRAQESMADDALRLLALAYKKTKADADPYENLVFIGLVGLLDPPRREVADAIAAFKAAGIRTIMITGDHPRTAAAIGRTLGIAGDGESVIPGRDLAEMSIDELAAHAEQASIYARITPEDKVNIVTALQKNGNVVGMLGDGVNDAAAIKTADIGVAMGITGTDVAKETSDIILLDDRFVTVTAAVEEGRLVMSNITKVITYLFSCNISEILTIFVGTVGGAFILGLLGTDAAEAPIPLLPLHILWMNLITDVFPALALAVEPPEPGLMKRPPRNRKEGVLSPRIVRSIGGYGMLITLVTLGSFFWSMKHFGRTHSIEDTQALARTVCFMTICLSQLFHAWTCRMEEQPIRGIREFVLNRYMVASTVFTIGLQVLTIYTPLMNRVLKTKPLALADFDIVLVFALLPLVIGQAIRWVAVMMKSPQEGTREAGLPAC